MRTSPLLSFVQLYLFHQISYTLQQDIFRSFIPHILHHLTHLTHPFRIFFQIPCPFCHQFKLHIICPCTVEVMHQSANIRFSFVFPILQQIWGLLPIPLYKTVRALLTHTAFHFTFICYLPSKLTLICGCINGKVLNSPLV